LMLDAARYSGAPLDEAQRREFAVRNRTAIGTLVSAGVLKMA